MKEKARKLEAKGQLDKAIRQYARILDDLGGKPELADELALYNKLGDLYVKLGNITAAVEEYEKAVNLYADQGFPNNAIALCNKVLRNAPGRTHIYLKLAKLMMQRGFQSEAKQNLLEYAERMQKAGKLEDAFLALKEFADLSPDNEEIRLILADQLKKAARTDEAKEQLDKLYNELQESGNDTRARATLEKMRAIDPEYDLDAADITPTGKVRKGKTSDIVFLDLDDVVAPMAATDEDEEPEEPIEPLDLEATSLAGDVDSLASAGDDADLAIETLIADETVDSEAEAVAPIEGLDVSESFDDVVDVPVPAMEVESTSFDDSLDVPEIEPVDELPDLDVSLPEDDIDVIGFDEIEELDVEEAVAESVDELPMLEVPSPDDDIEVIGLDEDEELEVEEAVAESVDELPMLEVPARDDDIVVIGLDEAEDLGERVEVGEATHDLPMMDVTSAVDAVEDIELEMPWDVGEAEPIPGTPEEGAPAFGASADVLEEVVAELDREDVLEGRIDVPAFDLAGVGDSSTEEDERAAEIVLEAPEGLEIAAPDISALEFAVADDPDAPAPHRELGEALIEAGDRERGMQELDFAVDAYQAADDMRHAQDVVEEILRVDPNSVRHHKKRVDFVLQHGEDGPIIDAYLELADALIRSESLERARFVYERVLERDPDNERAIIAFETLVPDSVEAEPEPEPELVVQDEPEVVEVVEPWDIEVAVAEPEVIEVVETREPEVAELEVAEPEVAELEVPEPESPAEPALAETVAETILEPEGGGFVDLGALIMDEELVAKDTRMRIDHAEPPDQEQQDFAEMLSEFKKGIDANIDADDAQAHYDLGVAFKEMGLLDEAISEFQKALRGSEDRLRTSESLGLCFFEKGQFAVAATVLRRAIESEASPDDDKIGLLYWLGRCEEEQRRNSEALGYYQRVFSIDINFQDVSDRVNALTDAGG